MLLAVDARNGVVALGLHDGASWLARFRLAERGQGADEYAHLIGALLRDRGADPSLIDAAALSSVVPRATPQLYGALSSFLGPGRAPLVVGPGVKTGLRLRTDNPAEVGSDLVCRAAAALASAGAPCLVVDYGAALTFSAIAAPADFVGAAIAPGLDSAAEALHSLAAQLPQVRLAVPERAVGRNTADSVRAGVVIGWTGLVDRLVDRICAELGAPGVPVSLVGTGDADFPAAPPTRPFDLWTPYLGLEGLRLIHGRNEI